MSASTSDPATRSAERGSGVVTILEDGVLSGILGAAVVAAFFLLLDFVRGEPLHTPSLLGSVLFLGKSVEEVTTVSAMIVFAYTGLHVLVFMFAGAILAWMVSQFEANPQFGMVLLLIFLLFEAVLFGFEVTVVPSLVGELGAWAVGLANLLSAVVMFGYLLRRHPEAMSRLRQGIAE
ncbi:MAG: hypothetical protein JSU66_16145 [Deltaproteobacteria bacterium]|nr:MAG: hypothetical protein JSU66_16145 [Deltaproteobacteria bacterium]